MRTPVGDAGGLALVEICVGGALLAASVAVAIAPTYLPMHDASSHIATAIIATELLAGDQFFAEHYSFDLVPTPYWGTTALMLPLLKILEPLASLDMLLAMYLVGFPLAYWWSLRLGAPANAPFALVAVLGLFNNTYWRGETNYLFGFPLVFVAFALFLGLRKARSWRFVAFSFIAVWIYLLHIFALCALLAAAGSLVLADVLRRWVPLASPPSLGGAHRVAAAWVTVLFGAGAWYVLFAHGTSANRGELVLGWTPARIHTTLRVPFDTIFVDGWAGTVFALAIVGLITISYWKRPSGNMARPVNAEFFFPAIVLLAVAFVGPAGVQEGMGFEDIGPRFAPFALLFALGAIKPHPSQRWRLTVLVLVASFGLLKVYDAGSIHREHDRVAQGLSRDLLARIPENSKVLPLFDLDEPVSRLDFMLHRFANYVVVERHSYNPHIFARTGQQPLRYLDRDQYRPVSDTIVTEEEWSYYDYLVVQSRHEPPRVSGLAEYTRNVGSEAGFRLYEILENVRSDR